MWADVLYSPVSKKTHFVKTQTIHKYKHGQNNIYLQLSAEGLMRTLSATPWSNSFFFVCFNWYSWRAGSHWMGCTETKNQLLRKEINSSHWRDFPAGSWLWNVKVKTKQSSQSFFLLPCNKFTKSAHLNVNQVNMVVTQSHRQDLRSFPVT